jgi:uncharacterized protein (TIGR01777 family)
MNDDTFRRRTRFAAPVSELFAWHERPGAFERLTPAWEPVRVLEQRPGAGGSGIGDGARVVLDVPLLPLPLAGALTTRWVIEHRDYIAGRQFRDVQLSGPFRRWEHTHRFEPDGDGSVLEDAIEYALPLGAIGRLGGGWVARAKLERLFRHRHAVTAADLERHARFADRGTLRVAVSGATGLIGRALTSFLTTGGHEVRRLVRSRASLGDGDVYWNPAAGEIDASSLDGLDAVIHLAGETVSERWSAEHKRAILDSRLQGTGLLARTLAALPHPPKVFVSASAVGYYGDGKDREIDESGPAGSDFLAGVARQWEEAAAPAAARGIRVVHPRFGVVLSAGGGALERLLQPFRLGAGGKLGNGKQWMSWISLDDAIGALHFLLFTESLVGPVNIVAPAPVTNAEFARVLGHVLHRPALATVPALALRLMFGEMANTMLLAGQRVLPRKLQRAGFTFRHPTLEEALRWELGR